MSAMKLRIAVLFSLFLITVIISTITPTAQAGMWIGNLEFNCTAKKITGHGLLYPSLNPTGPGVLYTIACGRHKPDKHVAGGVPVTEICQATSLSPNGKKPTVSIQTPSNCTVNFLAHIAGHCALSDGRVLGSISINLSGGGLKTIVLDSTAPDLVKWDDAIGGNLIIQGNTNKGRLIAYAQMAADRVNKAESCVPSLTGNSGADAFKIVGTGMITGVKAK